MRSQIPNPPAKGERITADFLQQLTRAVAEQLTGGAGMAVTASGNQGIIASTAGPAMRETLLVQRMRVVAVLDDYITCKTWDGANESSTTVNVAKPYILRRTPFDGETVNGIGYSYSSSTERTATGGGSSEDQEILPDWYEDEELYAVRGIRGGTGVVVDNAAVVWQDMNTAGRMWAVVS